MYTPDRWIIFKIKTPKESFYKVLAGWSGSYTQGQSWRINSGITKITDEGEHYHFHGSSGSIYRCHKKGYGTNMIMSGVLSNLLESKEVKVSVVPDQDFTKLEVK